MNYKPTQINAINLPDLWFQAIYAATELPESNRFKIDKGSYAGSTRLEFDYFIGHVKNPGFGSGTPEILPNIPDHYDIPNPVEFEYVYGGPNYDRPYIDYVMTSKKLEGESYTYGERLTKFPLTTQIEHWLDLKNTNIIDIKTPSISKEIGNIPEQIDNDIIWREGNNVYINQVEWVIECYQKFGHRNNQMVLQISKPDDILLTDPPCLRHIDTRIQDNKLHFIIYFRSWDLWGGLPANLAGIQQLKEYMAFMIGVEDGEMIVESKGLHLYAYAEQLARIRCMKEDFCK